MKGRRLPDTVFGSLPDDIQPGDFWKYLNRETGEPLTTKEYSPADNFTDRTNLTGTIWGYSSPDGKGLGTLALHTVREHEDGTISVLPGDGSSNSILHKRRQEEEPWHGYIKHGVWEEA